MSVAILVISIIAVLFFLVASILFFYFGIIKRKTESSDKSILLFALDLRERKVMSLQTKLHEKTGVLDLKEGKWIPTSTLLDKFADEEIHRLFREAMHQLEGGLETTSFMYVTEPHKLFKKESLVTFTFTKMEDTTEYTFIVKWEPVNMDRETKFVAPKALDLEQIANESSTWKGFIAFNTVSGVKDSTDKFIELIYRQSKKESFHHIVISGYVVLFLTAQSEKQLTKRINSFIVMMEKQGYKRGASHLFDGSAFVMSDKVTTVKAVGGIIKALDYFVNKSIKEKLNFVSFDENYDREEFNTFVEASKSFRMAIVSSDIKIEIATVRNWRNKRKTIEYIFPSVEGINASLLDSIMRNKNNKEQLMNANATNIAINQTVDLPVLVDINASWFLENKSKMVYKRAIYVINLNYTGNTNLLREAMAEMKEQGFVFAFRLTQLNEDIIMLIQNTRPGFIVIDHSYWGNRELFNTSLLIQLMTIRKLAASSNAKMIYEDPSEFVDNETAGKIGLDFFYSLKDKS